jgi:DNA invertase Pin-like site-specific DNA recombinase
MDDVGTLADAHRRRFSVVAVWKFDRMARSVSHLLRVLETFGSLGVDFVSLSEAIDTATPGRQDGLYRSRCRGRTRTLTDY